MSDAPRGPRDPDSIGWSDAQDAADAPACRQAAADLREVQQRLAAAKSELRAERADRQRLNALERRRAVRFALQLDKTARQIRQYQRRLRDLARTWERAARRPARKEHADPRDPFYAQVESLFGAEALATLVPGQRENPESASQSGSQPNGGPLVSIIMVVSHRSSPVQPTLESVRQQTYTRWELLVRSCDGERGLDQVRDMGDSRISTAALRSASEGIARTHALAAAHGELIAYLDQPNLWHPRFLERLVGVLLENAARYTVCCGHLDASREGGLTKDDGETTASVDYVDLVQQGVITLNGVVHRRELYDEIGPAKKDAAIGHDRDLLLKYGFLREPLQLDTRLLVLPQLLDDPDSEQQSAQDVRAWRVTAAQLRKEAETHFRDRLAREADGRRPSLTVIDGVGQLPHERAWDVAAVAGEVTAAQLVSFRFGARPAYGPRLLPSAETETLYLDGGRFPEWTSTLARAVANAHGDVVYAAEPRLPSLGTALLASHHHGAPVVVDLAHPPVHDGASDASLDAQTAAPLGLEEVDPSDAALLDPHHAVWDGVMMGLVESLSSHIVGSLTAAEAAESRARCLVLPHPKDEEVFNPGLYDRELARDRLGLGADERVLLCSIQHGKRGAESCPEVMVELASRFRLLLLDARTSARGDESGFGNGVHVIDRTDDEKVATAMAASDALLHWAGGPASRPHHGPPPELGTALAMELPVIADDIGDLGAVGRAAHVRLVPFGDVDGAATGMDNLSVDRARSSPAVSTGAHLFMRQFSRAAARANIGLILRMVHHNEAVSRAAEEFTRFFADFYRKQVDGRARGWL
jgi:uncharacterized protein YukE